MLLISGLSTNFGVEYLNRMGKNFATSEGTKQYDY